MKRGRIEDEDEEEEEEDDEGEDDDLDDDEMALIQQKAYETHIDDVKELVAAEPSLDSLRDTVKRVCAVCPTRSEFTGWRGLIAHAETIRDRKKFVNRHRGYHRALAEVLAPNSRMHGATPTPLQLISYEVSRQKLRLAELEHKKDIITGKKSRRERELKEISEAVEIAKKNNESLQRRFREEARRLEEEFDRKIKQQKADYERENTMLRRQLNSQNTLAEKEKARHLQYLQQQRLQDSQNARDIAEKLEAAESKKTEFEGLLKAALDKFKVEQEEMEMDLMDRESKTILDLEMQFEKEIQEKVAAAHAAAAAAPAVTESKNECSHCFEEFEGGRKRALLRPCGHALMCMGCAESVKTARKKCPHCDKTIESIHLVFK